MAEPTTTEQLQELTKLVHDQNILIRQMDWKMWVITNAICDALLANGTLEKDPRQ